MTYRHALNRMPELLKITMYLNLVEPNADVFYVISKIGPCTPKQHRLNDLFGILASRSSERGRWVAWMRLSCRFVPLALKIGLQTNEYGHLQINAVRANTDAPSRAGCCRSPFDGACGAVFGEGNSLYSCWQAASISWRAMLTGSGSKGRALRGNQSAASISDGSGVIVPPA